MKTTIFGIIILWILCSSIAFSHPSGHADGIKHLGTFTTPGVDKSESCGIQNKVLLYHDLEDDGIMDLCTTLWIEHSKAHVIISRPDKNGVCQCEGYLWLPNDTQDLNPTSEEVQ